MIKMDLNTYRDKVMGCWAGKNIGGILGAPFEGIRKVVDVDYYQQDLSMGPPPNDDLDLQIVWLAAVERYGRNVNASILGDYWLSYIIPNWVEYGTGKANMRAGLEPPISGYFDNVYKDSNGCWIRSEIWACLAPGHPEIAARYAYEDAIVDHAGEGMYGEIFTAALESAAFVQNDKNQLLEIGLSYIPGDSLLAKAIREAVSCYRKHVPFLEARKRIHNTAPGTFGIQTIKVSEIQKEGNEGMAVGTPGMDCPENIAFFVAAWLYGEDDFGRSLCLANSCGEDTDCTCGTLGAVMGIILGAAALPEKWTKPVDDKIATMCIDKTSKGIWIPETVTQLTERVIRDAGMFLGQEYCDILDPSGLAVFCRDSDDLYCEKQEDYIRNINGNGKSEKLPISELCALSPFCVRYYFPAFSVILDYEGSIGFHSGELKRIKVKVRNVNQMHQQQWVKITMYLPDGVDDAGGKQVILPLNNNYLSEAEAEFFIDVDRFSGGKLEGVIDVSLLGRHSSGSMKFTLMRDAASPNAKLDGDKRFDA
ncbi:MAG: ADP-ribosylglycohydrolase family protein [Bilifractor sp.]|jgi:ADP-ribosylglycohydrolase